MLLIKFQLNWIIIFRGDVQNMNNIFLYECIGPIQTKNKKTPVTRRFVQRLDPGLIWLWRRFLKDLTKYGHGGHLGQWTATILAIFHSPIPKRRHMKFEQHWPGGFRGFA